MDSPRPTFGRKATVSLGRARGCGPRVEGSTGRRLMAAPVGAQQRRLVVLEDDALEGARVLVLLFDRQDLARRLQGRPPGARRAQRLDLPLQLHELPRRLDAQRHARRRQRRRQAEGLVPSFDDDLHETRGLKRERPPERREGGSRCGGGPPRSCPKRGPVPRRVGEGRRQHAEPMSSTRCGSLSRSPPAQDTTSDTPSSSWVPRATASAGF